MTGKTIVYLPNWLGDMVMATPFLRSLRAGLDGELWGFGKGAAMHLYNGLDLFDRFITSQGKGPVFFLDTVNLLRGLRFARGVLLPHSFRSALLFYAVGIKERIGFARNKRGTMLTDRVDECEMLESTVEHYLKIADKLGCKRLHDAPLLCVTGDEEKKFDEDYTDINGPYAAFITGAQYGPSKCWPHQYFSELADMIIENHHMSIYMLPGKGEEDLAYKVYEGIQHKGQAGVKAMNVRDLKVCLSRASLVVSNDTGPRHMAVALSVPTVVLLGPMDERYTSYESAHTCLVSNDVPCRPCNRKKCDRNHECLRNIAPQQVFSSIGDILAQGLPS